MLINQMVKAQWQLARAERLEVVALDLLALPADSDGPDAPDFRIVNSIMASGRDPVTLFQRYAAQAERSYYKAYREFAAARKSRNEANLVAALHAGVAYRGRRPLAPIQLAPRTWLCACDPPSPISS